MSAVIVSLDLLTLARGVFGKLGRIARPRVLMCRSGQMLRMLAGIQYLSGNGFDRPAGQGGQHEDGKQ